jgi:hypothetical protein
MVLCREVRAVDAQLQGAEQQDLDARAGAG